jgi:sarcosine oxidase, subunit gamma
VTVEGLPRTAPLHFWSFVAMADLRVDPAGPAAAAVAEYLGVALPNTPSTWADGDTARVIWLGPDEWLVANPFISPEDLEAGLRAAVSNAGAVINVSAQRTTLRLRGEHVRDLLTTGCALDLHPRAFPAGSAAQTTQGLAGVVLLALDDTTTHYQLLVRSSFARYLATWLVDASTEFSPDPSSGAPGRNA